MILPWMIYAVGVSAAFGVAAWLAELYVNMGQPDKAATWRAQAQAAVNPNTVN